MRPEWKEAGSTVKHHAALCAQKNNRSTPLCVKGLLKVRPTLGGGGSVACG